MNDLISIEDDEVICPTCKSPHVHIIRTVVKGTTSYLLDGINSVEVYEKSDRGGSQIVIYYQSELCDHIWKETTWFHEGQTLKTLDTVHPDTLISSMEMWRD